MRTTVTLDPDTRLLVEQLMRERDLSFKEAVNTAIRRGLAEGGERRSPTVPRALGARVDLTKALDLADELADEEIAAKLRARR